MNSILKYTSGNTSLEKKLDNITTIKIVEQSTGDQKKICVLKNNNEILWDKHYPGGTPVSRPATCQDYGNISYRCSECGETITEQGWGPHNYQNVIIKQPTLSGTSGIVAYQCIYGDDFVSQWEQPGGVYFGVSGNAFTTYGVSAYLGRMYNADGSLGIEGEYINNGGQWINLPDYNVYEASGDIWLPQSKSPLCLIVPNSYPIENSTLLGPSTLIQDVTGVVNLNGYKAYLFPLHFTKLTAGTEYSFIMNY